jgi:uncharacterized membrane protein YedE/YeeE
MSEAFTPVSALAGGIMIGISASLLLLLNGRVAGISGILDGIFRAPKPDRAWRAAFVGGLLVGGSFFRLFDPQALSMEIDRSAAALAVAGLLVGFGTRTGSGCTSGHGVCGISRFSPRSVFATMTFMATAAITVFFINHVFGGRI